MTDILYRGHRDSRRTRRRHCLPTGELIECRGVIATALALSALAAAATAGGAVASGAIGAHAAGVAGDKQAQAAKDAAAAQTAAADKAEAFQRQQAENTWLNSQQVQRANYDQSKARYGSISGVASQYGLNLGGMPDYAPGIDPHFDTGASPLPGAGTVSGAAPAAGGSPSAFLKGLLDSGMDPQQAAQKTNSQFNLQTGAQAQYYAPSAQTSGKAVIGLPDAYISQEPSGWALTQRGGAGTIAGSAKSSAPGMAAPMMNAPAVNTAIPTPYQPGSIAALARRY